MAQASGTFRIFVSSTFGDLKAERNALQQHVFPRLRELCMQHGCGLRANDLRWGVSEEASLDQQTMNICLGEIRRCRRITPRPNFIVLLGDRYGWRPLPPQVAADEFEEICRRISPAEAQRLTEWYARDDNAVPPEYCLRPRTGAHEDYDTWSAVERDLHAILRRAVEEMPLETHDRMKYTASATEQEIAEGALRVVDAPEHVFGFFRTIKDLPPDPSAKDFVDLDADANPDAEAAARLAGLKNRLHGLLPGNVREYEARWAVGGVTTDHIDRLCDDVFDALAGIIEKEIARLEEVAPLDAEIAAHDAFGAERARFFTGRASVLQAIGDYLRGDAGHPLAIHGASGSGKSALMARAIELAREDHPAAEVMVRFIGATPGSSDGRELLEGLCRQISRRYGGDESTVPMDYRELVADLPRRLGLATPEKPLLLFLDALDQLSDVDDARGLAWLPADLPPHVRVVVSTLPGPCLSALQRKLAESSLVELEPMPPEEGGSLLDLWLQDAGRTLQGQQRDEVLGKFAAGGMPLYLRLAFEEARRWKSYTAETELSADIPGAIRDLLARLSSHANHGDLMVSRSLGHLAAARNGLSEDEMLDVLSADEEVLRDFMARALHEPPERRLPVVVWSRLYFDLEPYLTERSTDGVSLLAFYHRQLAEVVAAEYLVGTAGRDRHRGLAGYFGGQELARTTAVETAYNLWKLSELPYQQAHGELWAELKTTLTDYRFIEAKVVAVGTYPLTQDYELAFVPGLLDSRGSDEGGSAALQTIQGALRLSAHVLAQDGTQLAGQLTGRLLQSEAPAIEAMLEQARRAKTGPWLRPLAPSLTPPGGGLLRTLAGHSSWVNAVVVTPNGRYAVSASADDTLRVWDLETGTARHTLAGHSGGVRAVAVTPDGRYAVSGSADGTLRVWDVETGATRHTLRGHTDAVRAVAVTPDGRYAVSASRDHTVRVWDLETGQSLTTYHGESGFRACALGPTGTTVVAGEDSGRVHILRLENVASGPPVVTPWRLPAGRPWWQLWRRPAGPPATVPDEPPKVAFGCPFCRRWSEAPGSALGTELPCPSCGQTVRLNPFTIAADWRPVAAAWRGENRGQ